VDEDDGGNNEREQLTARTTKTKQNKRRTTQKKDKNKRRTKTKEGQKQGPANNTKNAHTRHTHTSSSSSLHGSLISEMAPPGRKPITGARATHYDVGVENFNGTTLTLTL
jgi:hypothetical protein